MCKYSPVGILDSGVGGISVLKHIRKILPSENIIYFADKENAPYGTKKTDEIIKLTDQSIDFLTDFRCKAIVIACNTATSAAADILRRKYKLPIIGLEPALKPAVKKYPSGKILLLATPATVSLPKLRRLVNGLNKNDVVCIAAPKLVEFIEHGQIYSREMVDYLKILFAEYKSLKFDACVLGCTHFPFAKKAITEALGYQPEFLDGGLGAARHLFCILDNRNLLNPDGQSGYMVWNNRYENDLVRRIMNINI